MTIAPEGHHILKDKVSRLFPADDSTAQEPGRHVSGVEFILPNSHKTDSLHQNVYCLLSLVSMHIGLISCDLIHPVSYMFTTIPCIGPAARGRDSRVTTAALPGSGLQGEECWTTDRQGYVQ